MTQTPAAAPPVGAPSAPDQYQLGENYMLGRGGVAPDLGMAAASFLNAADANDRRGLYAAGMMYLKGIGVAANPETAMGYLQQSAAAGHAPAKKVLLALSQGKDVSSFPIVVPASSRESGAGADARAPSAANPVTPMRLLAIVGAIVLLVGGSAGGYWAWSRGQARDAEQARVVAEQTRVAQERQQAADAERQRVVAEARSEKDKAASAMREAELEKQKAASQQVELAAQAEALKQREASATGTATATATATPARAPDVPVATAAADDWNAMLKQSMPHLRTMLDAALVNGGETVVRESAAIRALPQPSHGDRKLARRDNDKGLAALRANDVPGAIASLVSASLFDPADAEIVDNLGAAYVKAGRAADAQAVLQRAIYLAPTRSSAWYNLGLTFVAQNKEQLAYASFLLTYQFAGSQQKSRDWFEKVAQDGSDPLLQRLARRLIESPALAATARPAEAPAQQIQQVAAVTSAPPPQAALATSGKSHLQDFCGGKGNLISRSLCESRECAKPENRADPFCTDYFKRPKRND